MTSEQKQNLGMKNIWKDPLKICRARKVTFWLRIHTTLVQNLNSFPSTHFRQSTTICNTKHKMSDAFYWLLQACTLMHITTQRCTCTHIIKNEFFKENLLSMWRKGGENLQAEWEWMRSCLGTADPQASLDLPALFIHRNFNKKMVLYEKNLLIITD